MNLELLRRDGGRFFVVALLLAGLLVPVSFAQAQIVPPCNPLPGEQSAGADQEVCGVKHILLLLVNIYNLLLGLAAIVAFLFILFGAIRMLTWSIVEEQEAELLAAKRTITRAIAGFVIVALAYLIVNTLIVVLGGEGISEILKPLKG